MIKQVMPFVVGLFLCNSLMAQVPKQINYQGIARNAYGTALANQTISLRLTVRETSATGSVVYQETRTVQTNQFGLFSTAIGSDGATSVSGTLSGVNWANGVTKFLEVEMDPKGGSQYTSLGASLLTSVPFALRAETAAPVGAAGGDLAGNYPNPTIKDGAITAAKLAPGVIPTTIPVSGAAGGDLTGTYPNPTINANAVTAAALSNNAVTTAKVQDGAITAAKLAPGVIPTSLPISGTAGGDLAGSYPNPTIADNAITTVKVADASITAAKLAPGVIPTSLPASGAAGGDLTGTYPNPTLASNAVTTTKVADNAITTVKVADASITAAKLAPGVIPTSLPASGAAGGDLTGTYPNPTLASNAVTTAKVADNAITTVKVADASITAAKLAPGVIPTSLPASGAAGGDLSGTYPNPTIANNAITTAKVADASITAAKLAAGVIPTSLPPSGTAGGALTGTYPNPTLAANSVTTPKITDGAISTVKLADNAVTTVKVADGSITAAKLATGVIPTSLPPSGAAGGDLSGTYPNPTVSKINGIAINTTAPTSGQVLKYNGTQWAPDVDNAGGGGGLTFPYTASATSTTDMFGLTNSDLGTTIDGINSSTGSNAVGVAGKITNASPAANAIGVLGVVTSTGSNGTGVSGVHSGSGTGVNGTSGNGTGVYGSSTNGYGVYGFSENAYGVYGTSTIGNAAFFDNSNAANSNPTMVVTNQQYDAINAISTYGFGVLAATQDVAASGIYSVHTGGGEAVTAVNSSTIAGAISAYNYDSYAGVRGASNYGIGVLAEANIDVSAFDNGTALLARLDNAGTGNLAVFQVGSTNQARIDNTGKGYFNGGTQNNGADVAEFFAVEGTHSAYEPGDVLEISTESDRKVVKSSGPYSTLVAGVYATKPGVLLTEEDAVNSALNNGVPMGVIGVIPTKVCLEGGAIKRGDLLVTSSTSGVAMKGDPNKLRIGQVLGKALQDYNGTGVGKINVLVSVK